MRLYCTIDSRSRGGFIKRVEGAEGGISLTYTVQVCTLSLSIPGQIPLGLGGIV